MLPYRYSLVPDRHTVLSLRYLLLFLYPRGFKALKQLVKVLYKAKRYDEMMEAYGYAGRGSGAVLGDKGRAGQGIAPSLIGVVLDVSESVWSGELGLVGVAGVHHLERHPFLNVALLPSGACCRIWRAAV